MGWKSGDEKQPLDCTAWTDGTPTTTAGAVGWAFYAANQITVSNVFMGLTTAQAGAAAYAALYADDGQGRPGALIQDLGEIDLSATTGKRAWTSTATVQGVFWVVIWLKGVATQVTVRSPSAGNVGGIYPIGTTSLVSATVPPRAMWVATTYIGPTGPAPATAPPVDTNTQASVIMPTVKRA